MATIFSSIKSWDSQREVNEILENRKILAISVLIIVAVCGFAYLNRPKEKVELLIITSNLGTELMLEKIAEQFTEETGIKVAFVCPGGSGAVINKVIAEQGNPSGDIACASLPPMLAAKAVGALEHYISTEDEYYPSHYKDEDGYFYGWWGFHTCLVYNPKFCEAPKTFNDLLDPKWKGRLAYADPTTSGDGLRFIAAIIKIMGEDEGFEFLKKLEVNVARHDSIAIGQFIDKGELWCQVFNDAAVVSEAVQEGITGQVMCVTEEGTIAAYTALAIIKDSPHPEEAKLLYDFMLSEKGALTIPAGFAFPCRIGMEDLLPEELLKFWEPFLDAPIIAMDWQELADNMERWKTRWLEEVQPIGR